VSGDVVNLRMARKRRARDAARAEADGSAARHGEPKPARDAREAEAARARRTLEGHARDGDGSADGG
jgi:hypothetical protein